MPRSSFVTIVARRSREIWPEVSAHLAKLESQSHRRPGRRDASQETVWALARQGLVVTPCQQAVIEAVRRFNESVYSGEGGDAGELRHAVDALDAETAEINSTAPHRTH